jgi:class 3 adenylate cyclase/tetratricopeptide (TPR) repeat protein
MAIPADLGPHQAVILFADLVGSSRMSDVLRVEDYARVVQGFRKVANHALSELAAPAGVVLCEGIVRGDELLLIMVLPAAGERLPAGDGRGGTPEWLKVHREAAKSAFSLGVALHADWLLSECNQERLESRAPPHRLAVGIHYGTISLVEQVISVWSPKDRRWRMTEAKQVPEGFAINFAKRVETASRLGRASGIAVSQSFYGLCRQSGFPILVGDALGAEAKGFDHHEPVYEVVAQDVVRSHEPFAADGVTALLEKAFSLDPERTLWLAELAIETLFARDEDDAYRIASALAKATAGATRDDERLVYRLAKCEQRLGTNGLDIHHPNYPDELEKGLESALLCFRHALAHRFLVWANIDLAAAYWRRGTARAARGGQQGLAAADFRAAIGHCERVIDAHPRHFSAYNLRALVLAELCRVAASSHVVTLSAAESRLLELARMDLERAQLLNDAAEYMYAGTHAYVEWAAGDAESARKWLRQARAALDKAAPLDDHLPLDDFYVPGYVVLCMQPPRPSQLRRRWEALEREIDAAAPSPAA